MSTSSQNPDRDPTRREELLFILRHGGAATDGIANRAIDMFAAELMAKAIDAKFPQETDPQGCRLPDGFRRDVVVAVKCAVCEYEYDEDESYTVHFDSVRQATDAVKDAGWTALLDGRVVCDSDEEDHKELISANATGGAA